MSAPDLCDGCLAERAWCVCGVVASMSPIPATGGTIRRRGAHVAPPPPRFAVQDLDAGHDPGDEHKEIP